MFDLFYVLGDFLQGRYYFGNVKISFFVFVEFQFASYETIIVYSRMLVQFICITQSKLIKLFTICSQDADY